MNSPPIKHWHAIALLSALMAIPIFGYLSHLPIQLWDEARLANSAVELLHSHNWLLPTYGYKPDMWSTKPPFMIWLQTCSIRLLGVHEMAVRLPSAMAASLLIFGMYFFIAKQLHNRLLGLLAAVVLLTTMGYATLHVTRTADYDSLLITLISFAAFSFFLFLHNQQTLFLYAFFLLLALAVLTKGVAALLLTPAFFMYALYRRQFIFLLRNKHVYSGLFIFLFIALGYYLLRELYNPGYIHAVWANELGGRFATAKENNSGSHWYYLNYLFQHGYVYYALPAIAGIVSLFFIKDKLLKQLGVFALLIVLCHHIVISLCATKLYWYAAPEYPFLAILVALFFYTTYKYFFRNNNKSYQKFAALAFFVLLFSYPYYQVVRAVVYRPVLTSSSDSQPMALYLMKALHGKQSINNATLVWDGYLANLEFYRKALRSKGIPFLYNNGQTLIGNEKVIVYKHEIKQMIIDKFAVTKLDSFYNVAVYQLHGLKQ